jgi:putative FmdB family regulatory protein
MPTYEYLCSKCGNEWEEVQKISEPALEICPKCKKHTAKRQISAGNFILKGGGWYSDLYSSPKPAEKKSDGATETKASKDDSGGATKAEAKTTKESSPPPKTESSASKTAGSDGKSS